MKKRQVRKFERKVQLKFESGRTSFDSTGVESGRSKRLEEVDSKDWCLHVELGSVRLGLRSYRIREQISLRSFHFVLFWLSPVLDRPFRYFKTVDVLKFLTVHFSTSIPFGRLLWCQWASSLAEFPPLSAPNYFSHKFMVYLTWLLILNFFSSSVPTLQFHLNSPELQSKLLSWKA